MRPSHPRPLHLHGKLDTMKTIASAVLLTASLLLAAPAWAQLYDSASSLDLTSLTFKGIDFTLTPQRDTIAATLKEAP